MEENKPETKEAKPQSKWLTVGGMFALAWVCGILVSPFPTLSLKMQIGIGTAIGITLFAGLITLIFRWRNPNWQKFFVWTCIVIIILTLLGAIQ